MSYGIFSSVYDILTDNVDYGKIAEKTNSLLMLNGVDGGLLLDLGCGTGNLSFLLEKYGYDVIGVDLSEDMLAVANEKKYETGSNVLFLCQNAEELDLYGTVDCAVCSLDTINHIDSLDKIKKVFENVSLFMEMNGVFVFDINTLFKHREILGDNTFVYDMDEVYCIWQNTYCNENHSTSICLDFFIKNEDCDFYERYSESFFEYAYELADILKIAENCGFELIGCFDDYGSQKINDKTERITVALKKAKLIFDNEIK